MTSKPNSEGFMLTSTLTLYSTNSAKAIMLGTEGTSAASKAFSRVSNCPFCHAASYDRILKDSILKQG